VDFLDQLREARRMPEPKDYREWRRRISELEEAAAHGTHIETWPLPDGQTFRVTGRPHPDGAIAFLFEDITSEVSLTRRFRSELELGQAVVDSLGEALAVFSPSGGLVLSNAAYDALWGGEDAATLRPSTYESCAAEWQGLCQPSPAWPEMAAAVRAGGTERPGWSGELRLKDGRALAARVTPIAGNATLVGFTPQSAGDSLLAPVETAPAEIAPAETAPGTAAASGDGPDPAAAGAAEAPAAHDPGGEGAAATVPAVPREARGG
jgi:PAS domain-containing protein